MNIASTSKNDFIKTNDKVSNDSSMEKTKPKKSNELIDDNNKDFSCDKCNFNAINKVGLNLHKTLNHYQTDLSIDRKENKSVQKFSCEKCQYAAQSLTGLDAHIAFSH